MTGPIVFPTLQPSSRQPARQQDSGADEFVELVLGIKHRREQLELQRQQLEIQQNADSRDAAIDAATLRQKKDEATAKLEENEANRIATEAYVSALTAPGSLTDPSNIERARLAAIKQNPKLGAKISMAFNDAIKTDQDTRASVAQRRINESEAERIEATQTVNIDRARTEGKTAEVQLSVAQITRAIESARLALDPSRVAQMQGYMERGVAAGTARKLAGLGPIAGIPDDFVLPLLPGQDGNGSVQQQRAGPLLQMFRAGRAMAEASGDINLSLVNSLRSQSKSITLETLGNMLSGPRNRNLLEGVRMMAEPFRFFVSGQASAVAEAARLTSLIAPVVGDDADTRRSKRFVWDVVEKSMQAAAQGTTTPTQTMDNILSAAREQKLKGESIKVLERMRETAAKFEASAEYKAQRPGRAQASDATTRGKAVVPVGDRQLGQFFQPGVVR